MRRLWQFLRMPVPPAGTAEGARFTLGWLLAVTGIAFVTGLIYATGIAGNDMRFGLLLLAVSIASLYPCWRIHRALRRSRDQERKQPR